jgi:hypothetical protein
MRHEFTVYSRSTAMWVSNLPMLRFAEHAATRNTVLGRSDKSRYEHSGRVSHVDDGCDCI